MARPQALDHAEKRSALLKAAAKLFAEAGFDRTSMSEVARSCGVSKALLYHYYESKDVILYDILKLHLEALLVAVAAADAAARAAGGTPVERLERLAEALLESYRDANPEHKIQINELGKLTAARQEELKAIERDLVRLFADAICEVHPDLAVAGTRAQLLKPVTMSLFGMLNWHYLWFRPGGPLDRPAYARLAVKILIEGTRPGLDGPARDGQAPEGQVREGQVREGQVATARIRSLAE